jgi:predicted MPP superfamily phosphohydrolase
LLYVSRGSGTWGPPIRFLAPPEVTVIDLVPEKL